MFMHPSLPVRQAGTTLRVTVRLSIVSVRLSAHPIFYWAQCGNDRNILNEIHIFNKVFKFLLYSTLQKMSLVVSPSD